MQIYRTLAELHTARHAQLQNGQSVALIPTMGALHEGHLSLVDLGLQHSDQAWVSIFVNPTQFGPNEDLDQYPRTIEADLAACEARGVSGVFMPEPEVVYPPNELPLEMDIPQLTADLEGAFRPGHFQGVIRVVAKLLCMVRPDAAIFGQKDYQQLKVIEAMNAALMLPTRIIGHPIVRDSDHVTESGLGLALSSRNRYLSEAEKQQALGIRRALDRAQADYAAGERDVEKLEAVMREILNAHDLVIDYAVIRHQDTLAAISDDEPAVAVITARIGATRLLDNQILG